MDGRWGQAPARGSAPRRAALAGAGAGLYSWRMTRLPTAVALAAALGAAPFASIAAQSSSPPPPPAPARPATPATPAAPAPPPARPADVASVDAIITALYDVISGPKGQKRDWDRMRSLFLPGARLIPTGRRPDGTASARVVDVEGYIERSAPFLEGEGFFERELGRSTETFGSVVHAFSAYDSKHAESDAEPFARGVNSIQLYNDGARWWVVTVMWDSERPGNPVPARLLRRGGA